MVPTFLPKCRELCVVKAVTYRETYKHTDKHTFILLGGRGPKNLKFWKIAKPSTKFGIYIQIEEAEIFFSNLKISRHNKYQHLKKIIKVLNLRQFWNSLFSLGHFKRYQLFWINLEGWVLDLLMETTSPDFFHDLAATGNWWKLPTKFWAPSWYMEIWSCSIAKDLYTNRRRILRWFQKCITLYVYLA